MKITAVAAAFAPALVLASPRAAGLASPPDTEDALSPRDAHAPEHKLMSRDPNIRNSCKPLMLSDTDHMTISALCLNGQNQYQHSRVILNHCLRNNEGQLEKFRKF
ncbi:uncharacterized protein UV8b_04190 [Ustilaginoidea virens]|uniref:Cyanovirin-N domain-containing protein n=1 Tax=Ustilaginoidea virens TaxID=1159556 RepID=A0A8E5HRR2_USTVR|nr:uncharacterized protein UV8b_04190 [Ustilaginoidea virens]QUC19949.1 hypothetical protein UV8b_04190 [Ustilaginoidea virens]